MSSFRASPTQYVALAALIAGALVALVLAAGLADRSPSVADRAVAQETEVPTEAPTSFTDVEFRVASYEVFLGRDPFEPVVPEPVAAEDGATNGDGTETPTVSPDPDATSDPSDPSDPSGPTPTTDPGSGSEAPSNGESDCQQNGTVVCDGHTVSLVDVFEGADGSPRAAIRVDDVVHEVAPGDTFATNFRLLSVDGESATVQYGDDRFTLFEGETVLK